MPDPTPLTHVPLQDQAQTLLTYIRNNPGIQDHQLAQQTGWGLLTIHSNITPLIYNRLITITGTSTNETYHPTNHQYAPPKTKPPKTKKTETQPLDDPPDEPD